jgi:hypothetical protein
MLQMTQAADKAKSHAKKEEPLDTSRMKPIPADAAKPADIPNVSNVVS